MLCSNWNWIFLCFKRSSYSECIPSKLRAALMLYYIYKFENFPKSTIFLQTLTPLLAENALRPWIALNIAPVEAKPWQIWVWRGKVAKTPSLPATTSATECCLVEEVGFVFFLRDYIRIVNWNFARIFLIPWNISWKFYFPAFWDSSCWSLSTCTGTVSWNVSFESIFRILKI